MRRENRGDRPGSRVSLIHALLGATLLGVLVIPLAVASAKPTAVASGSSLRKQVKSLKTRLGALESKVAALENKPAPVSPGTPTTPVIPPAPTTLPPSGPAGGALRGTYPNPTLASGSVAEGQIVDGSVGGLDVADGSLSGFDVADGSLSGLDVADGSLTGSDIATNSVGAGRLKSTYEAVSAGVQLASNTYGKQTATCLLGDHVLGGGYAWGTEAGSEDTVANAPNRSASIGGGIGDNPDEWVVTARNSVNNNSLFAWAVCLRA